MARVKADSYLTSQLHTCDQFRYLPEITSNLTAFARHGLQQNRGGLLATNHAIQQVADKCGAFFKALSDVASGMKIVIISGKVFHSLEIVFHRDVRKFSDLFICRAGIQCIRCMRNVRR